MPAEIRRIGEPSAGPRRSSAAARRPSRLARSALGLAVAASLAGAAVPEADPSQSGALLYRVHCASCHGETGRGDGPMREVLTVEPTDLTRLARRNGDRFPGEQLRRVIDGRHEVTAHGRREMPVWGVTFQLTGRDTNQEAEVESRILQLVEFLESIQRD